MSNGLAWLILFLAGLCEVGWAIGLKYAAGFSRFWPSVWTLVMMVVSVLLLGWALKTLPLGTAYAVWTGIGAVGTALLGMYLFGEARDAARLACIARTWAAQDIRAASRITLTSAADLYRRIS